MQGSVEDTPTPQDLANDSSTKTAPVVRVRRGGHQAQNTDTHPHPKPSQGLSSRTLGLPTLGTVGPQNFRSWLYNLGIPSFLIITGLRTLGHF